MIIGTISTYILIFLNYKAIYLLIFIGIDKL